VQLDTLHEFGAADLQETRKLGRLLHATHNTMTVAAGTVEEVRTWLDDTRTLLRAAELLVEWFTEEGNGSDDYEAFKASLDLPYRNLALVDGWLRDGDSAPTRVSQWTAKRFQPSKGLAPVISPLLERIVMHEPDFFHSGRPGEPLLLLWGQFIGNFGMYVCTPVWEAFPECAPPGWSVHPKA